MKKIDKDTMIKVVGIAGTVLGIGANLMTSWSDEQKLNAKVESKVEEILAKKLNELGK